MSRVNGQMEMDNGGWSEMHTENVARGSKIRFSKSFGGYLTSLFTVRGGGGGNTPLKCSHVGVGASSEKYGVCCKSVVDRRM